MCLEAETHQRACKTQERLDYRGEKQDVTEWYEKAE